MHFKVHLLLGKLFQQVPPSVLKLGTATPCTSQSLNIPHELLIIYAAMLKPTAMRKLVCYIDVTPLQCVGLELILTKLSKIYRTVEKIKGFKRAEKMSQLPHTTSLVVVGAFQ